MNKATRKKRAQHLVQDETSNCYNVYTRIYTEELLSETTKSYSLLSVGDELASCRRGCRRIQHPTENPRNSSPLFFFLHPTTLHPGWFKLYFFFSYFCFFLVRLSFRNRERDAMTHCVWLCPTVSNHFCDNTASVTSQPVAWVLHVDLATLHPATAFILSFKPATTDSETMPEMSWNWL